jgi:hypothetical protein
VYGDLETRLDAIALAGGNVSTLTNGAAAAGQKVVTVDSTTGFIATSPLAYALVGGNLEYNTVTTVDSPTQLTLTTNIGTGGIADDSIVTMLSISEYACSNAIPHSGSPTLDDVITFANAGMYNVKAYGALGNGSTDDTAAIQAAIDAAEAAGAALFIPAGTYITSAALDITGPITILGAGRDLTIISNGASNIFEWQGDYNSIAHMTIKSTAGGGHCFTQTGQVLQNHFYDLSFWLSNTDKSVYNHADDTGNYASNWWNNFAVEALYTMTVPLFYFYVTNSTGASNYNTWENFWIRKTGNYGFWFESARSSNALYDMILKNGIWEVPHGGCVKCLGCAHPVIENQSIYDLSLQVADNHLFYFGKGTHATNKMDCWHVQMRGINHVGSSADLGSGIQDIYCEASSIHYMSVEHSGNHTSGALLIDYNNNTGMFHTDVVATNSNAVYLTDIAGGKIKYVDYPVTFTDGDPTPSVSVGNTLAKMFRTANTNPTTITMFDDGYVGQEIHVRILDTNTTIDFSGTNLKGNGGTDWTPTTYDHMICKFDGTNWYCNVSDNTA